MRSGSVTSSRNRQTRAGSSTWRNSRRGATGSAEAEAGGSEDSRNQPPSSRFLDGSVHGPCGGVRSGRQPIPSRSVLRPVRAMDHHAPHARKVREHQSHPRTTNHARIGTLDHGSFGLEPARIRDPVDAMEQSSDGYVAASPPSPGTSSSCRMQFRHHPHSGMGQQSARPGGELPAPNLLHRPLRGYDAFWTFCLRDLDLDIASTGRATDSGDGFEIETIIDTRMAEAPSSASVRRLGTSTLGTAHEFSEPCGSSAPTTRGRAGGRTPASGGSRSGRLRHHEARSGFPVADAGRTLRT